MPRVRGGAIVAIALLLLLPVLALAQDAADPNIELAVDGTATEVAEHDGAIATFVIEASSVTVDEARAAGRTVFDNAAAACPTCLGGSPWMVSERITMSGPLFLYDAVIAAAFGDVTSLSAPLRQIAASGGVELTFVELALRPRSAELDRAQRLAAQNAISVAKTNAAALAAHLGYAVDEITNISTVGVDNDFATLAQVRATVTFTLKALPGPTP